PDKNKWPWLRRVQPFTFNQGTHDLIQRGDELFTVDGVRVFFTRQGFFRFDQLIGHEPWAGQRFRTNRWRIQSNAQLFRWLRFYAGYGSLVEQREFRDDRWVAGSGRYQTTTRGLFLKASYLRRF